MQFSASEVAKVIGVNKFGSPVETFETLFVKNNRELLDTISEILASFDEPQIDIPLEDEDVADLAAMLGDANFHIDDDAPVPAAEAEYNEKRETENAIKAVNTHHGVKNEDKLYKLWEDKYGVAIGDRQRRFEKTYNVDGVKFRVVGHVDGVAVIEGADFIVELKSRVGHLKGKSPRAYELPQFLFYMDMSGIPRCIVFEEKDGKTRETTVLLDDYADQFQEYLAAIAAFVKRYEGVVGDPERMLYYFAGSEYDRNEMLTSAKLFA